MPKVTIRLCRRSGSRKGLRAGRGAGATFKPALLARGDLPAAAAAVIQSGCVKLGAELLEQSGQMPIASALDMRAGDLDDPLRRAVTLLVVVGGEDAV